MRDDDGRAVYEAASMYYAQGETMEVIARHLGVSRSTVSRLLARARAEGVVRIELVAPGGGGLERRMGEELRAAGVDFTFAPVLDLDWGRSSVIGNRAFHHDPRVVAMLARCVAHGLLLAGMANCGKHFPGHGFADADSHVAMPEDTRSLDEILADDAAPYAWLGTALTAVMPAHVIYPQVDRKPAGFSRKWLQTILRRRLGFDGLIFSDDLTMEAATVAGDITARASAALKAGCDMVLVCNRPDLADELLANLQPPENPHLERRLNALRPRVIG